MSSSGSLPVEAATWLISTSRACGSARRVEGSCLGLGTFNAGFSSISPSAIAWAYMHRNAAIRCSAALPPPLALRRFTTFAFTTSHNCLISEGVGSSIGRWPQCSRSRFQ